MTLTITLALTPEEEEVLRRSVQRRDTESVRRLLANALVPAVEEMFQAETGATRMEDWDALIDDLVEVVETGLPPGLPPLSDYAVSREGIYGDHS